MANAQDFNEGFLSYCKQSAEFSSELAGTDGATTTSQTLAQKLKKNIEGENEKIEASTCHVPIMKASGIEAVRSIGMDAIRATQEPAEAIDEVEAAISKATSLRERFDALQQKKSETEKQEKEASKALSDLLEKNPVKFSPNVWTAICVLGVLYCAQLSLRPARINQVFGLDIPLMAISCMAIVAVVLFALCIFMQFKKQKAPNAEEKGQLERVRTAATDASKASAVAIKQILDFDYAGLKAAIIDANLKSAELIERIAGRA